MADGECAREPHDADSPHAPRRGPLMPPWSSRNAPPPPGIPERHPPKLGSWRPFLRSYLLGIVFRPRRFQSLVCVCVCDIKSYIVMHAHVYLYCTHIYNSMLPSALCRTSVSFSTLLVCGLFLSPGNKLATHRAPAQAGRTLGTREMGSEFTPWSVRCS